MTALTVTAGICDRQSCPAQAQRAVLLHGQDFYFCGHHAAEMQGALAAVAATEIPLADPSHTDDAVVLAWREDVVADGVPAEDW